MNELYPFLSGTRPDDSASLVASTIEKAQAIVELRHRVGEAMRPRLVSCAQAVADRLQRGGRIFTMGNGGSATDAEALAQVFANPPRGTAWPAVCLTADVAVLTALSNDVGYSIAFSRQLAAQAQRLDVLVGLSTSGNSENVLLAFDQGHRQGLLTIGFAGSGGGHMAETSSIDHLFVVPADSIHRIQEAQTTLYHVLWELTHSILDRR